MTSFMTTLKEAREAKGLTTSQLAAETHILVQIIEDLEKGSFKRIPAAIYGRGFLRLLGEHLNIDAKPLIADFNRYYEQGAIPEGIAAAEAASREASGEVPPPSLGSITPEPAAVPTPEPATPSELPTAEQIPAPAPEPAVAPAVAPTPEPIATTEEQPPVVRGLDLFEQRSKIVSHSPSPFVRSDVPDVKDEPQGPSAAERFRSQLSSVSHGVLGQAQRIPKSVWRYSLLGCVVAVILAVVIGSCVALYRFTETPDGATREAEKALATEEKPKATPKTTLPPPNPKTLRSTGEKVPPLYID